MFDLKRCWKVSFPDIFKMLTWTKVEKTGTKSSFVKSLRHKMLVTFLQHISAIQKLPDRMNWYFLLHRDDSGNLYYTHPHTLAGLSVSSKITSTRNRKLGIVSVSGTAASVSHKWKRHRCGPPRRSAVSVGTGVQTKGHMADQVSFGRLIQWWEANGPNRVVISARERNVPSVRDKKRKNGFHNLFSFLSVPFSTTVLVRQSHGKVGGRVSKIFALVTNRALL